MKKQFLRVKQIADQTFLRAEKTEVLTEDLVNAEKRVDIIKQSFQAAHKKIASCQIDFGSEGSAEKRMKKLPQVALAASMLENGYSFSKNSVLGATLKECASTQAKLGNELLEYYNEVEKSVLKPISSVLENEVHSISKLRKQLGKLTLDMDSARNRFLSAEKQQASSATSLSASAAKVEKVDTLKDELEEASLKVEQCRDALACEMFSLISKEPHLSEIFVHLHKLQANYHRHALAALEASLPVLEKELGDFPQKPVYGCPLLEHLRVTDREIAHVIETCVYFLLEYGILEEGLLRITGSASKLKKLKSAFDAGLDIDMTEYIRDPHAVSGALKSYLRELPEPLLSFSLYDEWVNAVRIPDFDQRLQALWQVLYKLPQANFVNLRCLVKFLSKVCENSDVNKMSSQNIAIIMAPNLIWNATEDSNFGMNMQIANLHSTIVDMLVTYADWFFPDMELSTPSKSGSLRQSYFEEEPDENIMSVGSDLCESSLKALSKSVKKLAAPPPPPKKIFFHEKLEESTDSTICSDKPILTDNATIFTNISSDSAAKKSSALSDVHPTAPAEDVSSPKTVLCRRSNENIASLSTAGAAKSEKPSVPEKPLSYSSFSLDRKIQRTSIASKNLGQDKVLEYVPRTQRPTVPPPERPAKPSRFSVIENSAVGDMQKSIPKFDASVCDHPENEMQPDSQISVLEFNDSVTSDVMLLKQHFDQDFSEQSSAKTSAKQNRFDFLVAQTVEKPPERPPRSFPFIQDHGEGTNLPAEGINLSSIKDAESPCSPKAELPTQVDVVSSCVAPVIKSPEVERPKPPRPQPPIPYAKPKTSFSDNTNL